MKRIVVTGAGGFAGRVLCPVLAERGFDVLGTVRPGRTDPGLSFPVVEADILDASAMDRALAGADAVVHLAGIAHRSPRGRDAALYDRVNFQATVDLARRALALGAGHFLFASTALVHGTATNGKPMSEVDPYAETSDPYAASKIKAEKALTDLASETGLDLTILRPTLMFGPKVKANFRRMLWAVGKGLPLPLGRVRSRRSYLYVENFARLAADCLADPKAARGTFLAADFDMELPEMLKLTARRLGMRSRVFSFPVPAMKLAARLSPRAWNVLDRLCCDFVVDASRAARVLGYRPRLDADQSIRTTCEWYMGRHG